MTVLGDKSITNKLDFKVVDIDEDPLVNLNLLSLSLKEDTQANTKFGEVKVFDPERNGITYSVSGVDKDKVDVSDSGNLILSQALDYETKKDE